MLLVLENSTHDTSNDVVQLFGPRLHWLLDKVTPLVPVIVVLFCGGADVRSACFGVCF